MWPRHLADRVAVKFGEERVARRLERAAQAAVRCNHTGPALTLLIRETADQRKVAFRGPHDLAHGQGIGLFDEPQAAVAPAYGLDPAEFAELLNHLHQVILGDAVRVRDVLDGRQALATDGEVQ